MNHTIDPTGHSPSTHLPSVEDLKNQIIISLEEDKAEDIVIVDLTGKSDMADYMIIASGRSNRHVGALADKLIDRLKKSGISQVSIEGVPHCDWVLIDTFDVIVHLFRPEIREFYNLEKMWKEQLPASSEE